MTVNLNAFRLVIGIVVLVISLVLGITGLLPPREAGLFMLCGIGIMLP